MGNWNAPFALAITVPPHSFSHQCGCEGRGGMRMTAIADEVRRARRGAPARAGPAGAAPGAAGRGAGRALQL
jgi:hypothetical protein